MNFNPFSLEGKSILVTGASSGIGRGIAIECSKMGAKIVATGRNEIRLEETAKMLYGDGHSIIVADISEQDGIDTLVSKCPSLNGIVFCAGVLNLCSSKSVSRKNLIDTFNINTISPILLIKGLSKSKKILSDLSIVLISSLSGVYIGGTGEISYSASKGALCGFMKTAAIELAQKRIRLNSLCPALVPTDLSRQYHDIVNEEDMIADIPNKYPLGRIGTTDDIAYASIFLLSDCSSWITGVSIPIDGGLILK